MSGDEFENKCYHEKGRGNVMYLKTPRDVYIVKPQHGSMELMFTGSK